MGLCKSKGGENIADVVMVPKRELQCATAILAWLEGVSFFPLVTARFAITYSQRTLSNRFLRIYPLYLTQHSHDLITWPEWYMHIKR